MGVDRWTIPKASSSASWQWSGSWRVIRAIREKFTFIQIGAPSRRHINDIPICRPEGDRGRPYQWRFQPANRRPIVFLKRQLYSPRGVHYYRAADLCMVTSLHDGMNLVAKEFVAARSDERGVLILSRFTGAARDLRDAIIVNPYDVHETGEAIAQALEMDVGEIRGRMRRMRRSVKDHNIYWWAGTLIGGAVRLRQVDEERWKNSDVPAAAKALWFVCHGVCLLFPAISRNSCKIRASESDGFRHFYSRIAPG